MVHPDDPYPGARSVVPYGVGVHTVRESWLYADVVRRWTAETAGTKDRGDKEPFVGRPRLTPPLTTRWTRFSCLRWSESTADKTHTRVRSDSDSLPL